MEEILALLIPIIAILAIFVVPVVVIAWVIISLVKSRSKERMGLIGQGIEPKVQRKAAPNKYTTLRNGCLFIGLAIGLIVGMIVDWNLDYSDIGSFLIMLTSSILFLGIGYIIFFMLVRNKNMDEEL